MIIMSLFISRNDVGISGRGTLAVSAPGSSERFELCSSLSCFMHLERMT